MANLTLFQRISFRVKNLESLTRRAKNKPEEGEQKGNE